MRQRRRRERHRGGSTARGGRPIRDREPLPTRVRDLPALPDGYQRRLDAGLAELGLDLPSEARRAIDDHLRLLLAWTGAINLTAIRDPETAATAHVLDSLAAVGLIRELGSPALLDLGSGGGYPGLPLAATVPADAVLVDSIAKKARFLETAVAAVDLTGRVGVVRARAEELAGDPAHRGRWSLVTARAVADLGRLIELAWPLLRPGGSLLAWKRGDIAAETATGRAVLTRLGGGHIEVRPVRLERLADHVLVRVERPAADRRD